MRTARRHLFLCASLLALAPGCEEAREADLLDIESVGPAQLDPGHPLVIEGGPFAIHHAVRVRLIGELARPFTPPEAISEELPAQAVTEQRIEVTLPPRTLAERFGRATFRGRVEVREEALWAGAPGAVLGRASGVVIDFVPPRTSETPSRSLDRVLGLAWAHESARGLTIAEVQTEGRGATLGLMAGDVLLGDGDASFVPGDAPLVPASATTLRLRVARPGEGERALSCVLGDRHDDDAARDLARLTQLAIVLLWIAMLGALPLGSADYAAAREAPALGRPSAAMIARAALSVALAYGLVRVVASGVLPPAPFVIAALAGLRAALRFADARGDLRAVPLALFASLGLGVGLALLPIAEGSADLGLLLRDASPSPLDWPMFAQPVGPIALALVGVSVAATRVRGRMLQPADDLLLLCVATLAIVEGTGLAPTGRSTLVALSLSIALVTWLLGYVRGRAHPLAVLVASLALVALAAVALGAWTFSDPSPLVRRTAAETVLAMCVVLGLALARRAMTPRIPARAAHALL